VTIDDYSSFISIAACWEFGTVAYSSNAVRLGEWTPEARFTIMTTWHHAAGRPGNIVDVGLDQIIQRRATLISDLSSVFFVQDMKDCI